MLVHPISTCVRRLRKVAGLTFLISCCFLFSASPAYALSSDEAVRTVQHQYGGQVLDIQTLTIRHATAYRIKLLLPSGRVKVILMDAASGRYLTDNEPKKP